MEITGTQTRERLMLVPNTLKQINYEQVPIWHLCLMEIMFEESERAKSEGREGLAFSQDRLKAKIAEKEREKKNLGKVSTFLSTGHFCTGDVIINHKTHKGVALMKRGSKIIAFL